MAPMRPEPALSVVVVADEGLGSVRRLLDHLRRQTVVEQLEVVLVAPDEAALAGAAEALSGFGHVQTIACDGQLTRGSATERGVRSARAPIVALSEDHSYPDSSWAERLLAVADTQWVAIGSSIVNGNPRTVWSRVNHDLSYGRWNANVPAGEIDDVPGFNSIFVRDALLALDDELEPMLDRVSALHRTLRERGGRFAFQPEAVLTHWSPSVRLPSVRAWFSIGRYFGSCRAAHERWSGPRRAIYGAAAPLIALMRLRSHWRAMRSTRGAQRKSAAYYAVLATLISVIGFGESYGYLAGEGSAIDYLADFEFRRERFLVPRDREAFLA
jgi:glycosyl transferase family 2